MNNSAVKFESFSCPGRGKTNQDNLISIDVGETDYFAIADGMGGAYGGEVASRIAVQTVESVLNKDSFSDFSRLYSEVHQRLLEESAKDSKLIKMGTTLTICSLTNFEIKIGHVGDCRIYLLRDSGLKTLTRDQTEVRKLIDEGVLHASNAHKYHRKHVLLSVLSPNSDYSLAEYQHAIQSKDRIIMITDGVYNVVSKEEIRDISKSQNTIKGFCEKLREIVQSRQPKDDYTAICLQYT